MRRSAWEGGTAMSCEELPAARLVFGQVHAAKHEVTAAKRPAESA